MTAQLHITHACGIRNGIAWKDEALFYTDPSPANTSPANTSSAHTLSSGADYLLSLYKHLGIDYPKFYKMDPLSKLGWLASEILLQGETPVTGIAPEAVGMVLTNANSSLDTDRKYLDSVHSIPSPGLFVYTLPNIMLGEIAIRRGFKGENGFFIFPHFDADFLQHYIYSLFASDAAQVVIGGWVDLLGDQLDAFLFLVSPNPGPHPFTTQALTNLYNDQPKLP